MDTNVPHSESRASRPMLKTFDMFTTYSSYELIALLVSLVVIFLTAAFLLWRRAKVARRGILLMGLSDSGKTLMICHLLHGMFKPTVTSTKENLGEYSVKNKSVKVIDIPGHERLRYRFFEQYKSTARGIIFVVDSVTVAKDIRDAAEFLYTILSDATIISNKMPLLIVCNKQDETMAKGATVVQSLLEKEMNVLRVTKSNQLQGIEGIEVGNSFLGKEGKDFQFDQLWNRVDFGETSASKGDETTDLEAVEMWLEKVA